MSDCLVTWFDVSGLFVLLVGGLIERLIGRLVA